MFLFNPRRNSSYLCPQRQKKRTAYASQTIVFWYGVKIEHQPVFLTIGIWNKWNKFICRSAFVKKKLIEIPIEVIKNRVSPNFADLAKIARPVLLRLWAFLVKKSKLRRRDSINVDLTLMVKTKPNFLVERSLVFFLLLGRHHWQVIRN